MIIINGKIITWEKRNRILGDHAIYIKDDKILAIDQQKKIIERYPEEECLDAHGQLVMPGNICGHTHFYGAYSRGMAIPGKPARDFPEILEKLWWSLDKALTPEAIQFSALVCMADAIRHGTTTLIDHHASPNAIDGSLDIIAEAAMQTGLRVSTCYEVSDRDGLERTQQGIHENVRFIKKIQKMGNKNLGACFGLHASLTLSEDTLVACSEAIPNGVGFHIHAAEHQSDQYDSLEKTGDRVIDRLNKHGILGNKTIVAHAVHVDAREVEILADTGTWVTHQPRSNMNNAVGMSEVESLLRAGVRLGMGNDGFSNAMWEEWKTTYLVHKLWHRDPRRVSGYDVIEMAVYNNAELATTVFYNEVIGKIVPGAQADIIFVDYHPFTPLTPENLPWHIVFGFHESMITTTMVAGQLLMKNREFLTIDSEEISRKALKIAPSVWENYEKQCTESIS